MAPCLAKRCQWAATATVSKPYPQESESADPEPLALVAEGVHQHRSLPLAIPQTLEVTILADTTPLPVNVGAAKRVYHCWVEGCHKGPSISHVAICAHVHRDHLGVRLPCPSCPQAFLKLDPLRKHKKTNSYIGVS